MVDLQNKAQWHIDINGGGAPMLEFPSGDMIPDSGIIVQYALEANRGNGIELIPSDPMEAAKMRMKMEKFNKAIGPMFGVILSRGQDEEKILKYKTETLPIFEAMCTEANGKFLFGTDDLTAMDIHCAPMWEIIFLFEKGVYADCDALLQIRQNAPNWCAYMQKFRAHPAIKPYRFCGKASDNHGVRSRAWDPEQKCQLSIDVLDGAFPDQDDE